MSNKISRAILFAIFFASVVLMAWTLLGGDPFSWLGNRTIDISTGSAIGIGIILAMALVYFLPTIVAASRQHQNGLPIFVVNLFLGWSLIGWVIALAWSLTAVTVQRQD